MTQQGLIKKVIAAGKMEECNPNFTPAAQEPLGMDPEGEPFSEKWEYASIVGMLQYLSTNTRSDITYAVSQVSRFTHSPKKSHGQAVKTILRYLKGTQNKGTIVKLDRKNFRLDAYVDADFAGLYKRDPDCEPTSAKSRMGYVLFLAGFPLVWKSQLQQEIALSTAESEYAALSTCLKTVIPLLNLLKESANELDLPQDMKATISSHVFEDNAACLQLATKHRLTNRTRWYHTKWHWFWSHVNRGTVKILKVDTKFQRADPFTKGLNRETFERIREMIIGW
jgi:hypothetical protein